MAQSSTNTGATSQAARPKELRRRSWSEREEKQLLNSLKELITLGWKCENDFRVGYLTALEKMMSKALPDTDLRADPHINSKIHVWKKNYGSISTMLARSGFGWNDIKNEILVDSDDVWDNYVKSDLWQTDPSSKNLRRKSFPYYKDWCEIFGKDRATGENAVDFNDFAAPVNEPYIPAFTEDTDNVWEDFVTSGGLNGDGGTSSAHKDTESTSTTSKKGKGKKRKSVDHTDSEIISLMGSFCNEATTKLGNIAEKIGYEYAASEKRSAVYAALGSLGGLSTTQKIFVCKKLVNNKADLDMFFSLLEEDKMEMVRMIISGQLD